MDENCSSFKIPNEPAPAFNFGITSDDETMDVYEELNRIAEEIEECRLRNC